MCQRVVRRWVLFLLPIDGGGFCRCPPPTCDDTPDRFASTNLTVAGLLSLRVHIFLCNAIVANGCLRLSTHAFCSRRRPWSSFVGHTIFIFFYRTRKEGFAALEPSQGWDCCQPTRFECSADPRHRVPPAFRLASDGSFCRAGCGATGGTGTCATQRCIGRRSARGPSRSSSPASRYARRESDGKAGGGFPLPFPPPVLRGQSIYPIVREVLFCLRGNTPMLMRMHACVRNLWGWGLTKSREGRTHQVHSIKFCTAGCQPTEQGAGTPSAEREGLVLAPFGSWLDQTHSLSHFNMHGGFGRFWGLFWKLPPQVVCGRPMELEDRLAKGSRI